MKGDIAYRVTNFLGIGRQPALGMLLWSEVYIGHEELSTCTSHQIWVLICSIYIALMTVGRRLYRRGRAMIILVMLTLLVSCTKKVDQSGEGAAAVFLTLKQWPNMTKILYR